MELATLGEQNGVRVDGAVYPHPSYEGNPWSQWGQGIALADGRFFSAIGDHIGADGNSYLYEYDPETGLLTTVADILSYVEHQSGSWGYGKVHGQMVNGPCGEIYLSTYWGSFRGLQFGGSYTGDVLFRLDPYDRTLAPLGVPVERHGSASLASSAELGLVYGEAVDPILKGEDIDRGPFFVYDVETEEVVFAGPPEPHVGYRNIIVDAQGRAYYSIGGGELAVYSPESNQVETHPQRLPGDWLRASTVPAPDGRIVGVTREPDRFFALDPDGGISDLGPARGYTTSMALSPEGSHFYYMPDAHGGAWSHGAPLIRVDTETGDQETIIELAPLVEQALGLRVGGTYNVAVGPQSDVVYLGANASPLSDESGFGEVILLVIHLP